MASVLRRNDPRWQAVDLEELEIGKEEEDNGFGEDDRLEMEEFLSDLEEEIDWADQPPQKKRSCFSSCLSSRLVWIVFAGFVGTAMLGIAWFTLPHPDWKKLTTWESREVTGGCACDTSTWLPKDQKTCKLPSSTNLRLRFDWDARVEGQQAEPCVAANVTRSKENPVFSLLLTVHDSADGLANTIHKAVNYTTEPWELVVVFDSCSDHSLEVVQQSLGAALHQGGENLVSYLLVVQSTPIFETIANNLAMRLARGTYFILLQDDMQPIALGWNSLMAVPFRLWNDTFAVTGMCAHSVYSHGGKQLSDFVGSCAQGSQGGKYPAHEDSCHFRVRDSANRGPLMYRASMMKTLGYFDEEHFYLGDDDHDAASRAYINHRWVSGSIHTHFSGNGHEGSTRTTHDRPPSELEWLEGRKERIAKSNSFLDTAKSFKLHFHDEDRSLKSVGCGKLHNFWDPENLASHIDWENTDSQ